MSCLNFFPVQRQMALVRLSSRKDNCGNISHNDNVMKRELNWIDTQSIELSPCKTKKQTPKTRKQTKLVSCLGHDHLLSLSVLDERGSAHCFYKTERRTFCHLVVQTWLFIVFFVCRARKGRGGSIRAFQLLTAETKVKEQLRGCE